MKQDRPPLVLLPGLDGTGELFRPLLDVIPMDVRTRVVSYPPDRALSYAELLDVVKAELHDVGDVVLVAESFSGPLALRYAAEHPDRVRAVVLCATFIRPPVPRWLGILCRQVVFRRPPPAAALRRLMVGRDASDALVEHVRRAIGRVRPGVLAARLGEVLKLDAEAALRLCQAPVLYLAAKHDALLRASTVTSLRSVCPDMRVRTLNGPHLLLQREPRAAWQAIEQFLTDIAAGR